MWSRSVLVLLVFGFLLGVGVALVYPKKLQNVRGVDIAEITPAVLPTGTKVDVASPPIPDKKLGYKKPGAMVELPSAKWVPQTFNNCGPATVSMLLQYFGYSVGQNITKAVLRTNPTDSNVFAYEIGDYLRSEYDIQSKLLFNGDLQMIKTLLANGFYIMVEDWLHPYEDIGHNLIIRGYDDGQGVLITDDSFVGVGTKYKYDVFDAGQWKPFNREYLPVYKAEMEPLLRAIVGDDWDEKTMYERSVKTNQAAVIKDPNDMYSWFNLGTSYYGLGRYTEARDAFEKSRGIGWPRRMLWYQYQPVQTYNKLGEYEKALELVRLGLVNNDSYPELHFESAVAYKGLGDLAKARVEKDKAVQLAPKWQPAQDFAKTL